MPPSRADANLVALGAVLRQLREAADLSQDRLGDLAGLHRTFVGGIERGERNVSFRKIRLVLSALNVSWEEFGRRLDLNAGSAISTPARRDAPRPRRRVRKKGRAS